MTEKLLSIVVPTKNRYFYLKYLVAYFHEIKDDSIEMILQDNSDEIEEQPDFLNYLEEIADSRIIYNFIAEKLSVIENSDQALLKATGEYVTFLGDDDIFSKHIISFLKEAKGKNIAAILPEKSSYSWPDIKSRLYGNKLSGKFTQTKVSGSLLEVNAKHVLNNVLQLGGTDIINLPRVYHGIVQRDVLNKIYKETTSYFPGPSPDMANAVAICKFIEIFIYINIPFIVSGHSSKSTGGQGAAGKHFGEIRNIAHLPKNTADNWSPEVPFYWSGFTIYAESVLQALKNLDMKEELKKFNYQYLYAQCLVYDTKYSDRIKKNIAKYVQANPEASTFNIYISYLIIWKNRLMFHLKNNLKYIRKSNSIDGVYEKDNIYDVAMLNDEMIGNYLKSKNQFL